MRVFPIPAKILLWCCMHAVTAWGSPAPGTQPANSSFGSRYEWAPHTGFMGASALLGIRASMVYGALQFEASAEQVMGRAATLYPLTGNLLFHLSGSGRVVPYGLIGGGLFLTVPENAIGGHMVSSLGMNFGGGLRYFLNPRLGIRFETRQLFTSLQNVQDARQELLIFQETTLGIILPFG